MIRIGQEPPKPEDDEPYDGRTLYEKLQTQKVLLWSRRCEWTDGNGIGAEDGGMG
jgi:hypothetical protein